MSRNPSTSPETPAVRRRGFTLVEILIAMLLLSIVGTALVGFLSALAAGGEARQRISDPAIESTLAVRRFNTLAPEFRAVLAAGGNEALVWVSDRVASRSVHLSEVALLRFDPEAQELVLESPDPAALADDRTLEHEYLIGQYDSLVAALADLRTNGMLSREILAEGIDSVEFNEVLGSSGLVDATFSGPDSSARIRLAPGDLEEPLR